MANESQGAHVALGRALVKVGELEREHTYLVGQKQFLEQLLQDFDRINCDLVMEKEALQRTVGELEQARKSLENKVHELQERVEHLQNLVEHLQNIKPVEPTHRNIFYSEGKSKKRLPVFRAPVREADEVGSLVFGECFAVSGQQADGKDLWLQMRGGDCPDRWVLGCDAGTVNCVDMTNYHCEKYRTRIQSNEYHGQNFPKKMCTEGFAGSSESNVCLVSASRDSFWREINIEMLLRGIASATVFEEDLGGDRTFSDSFAAYYYVNCVQYGQLRTPLQKRLKVTVKPTRRWRDFQAGSCLGPNLDSARDVLSKAQYEACCWLKGMKDQLHVKWKDVEFLTAFAFLRAHCAWTLDDCKEAANDRFMWLLQEFFLAGCNDKVSRELDCAIWLWQEAFDGCFDEAVLTMACTLLHRVAKLGARPDIPRGFREAKAAPLAWRLMVPALSSRISGGLSVGGQHCLALDAEGTLHSWGSNDKRQCSVPTLAPCESWAAASAGFHHSLGLTDAGVLHAWGSNLYGQCSAAALGHGERWVAMSAGSHHSLGLTAAGVLHAWGENNQGQCSIPVLPPGERWAIVSAGEYHSLGLTVGGLLYAWGYDSCGQCTHVPTLPQGESWAAISGGWAHSLALTATGRVYAWGDDRYNQCSGTPTLARGERWTVVSAGGFHSLGVTSAGTMHAWGHGGQGQCKVPPGKQWLAASAGDFQSLGITSAGVVRAWGRDDFDQVSRAPKYPD